jgi:undecaprenyl-diphosphatase
MFQTVNAFAVGSPWLHGPMVVVSEFGVLVFAGLLVSGWWIARRSGNPGRQAAALWAPIGTVLAVAVNQPLAALFDAPRPVLALPDAYILLPGAGDPGLPSDHATMAGAVAFGLFLVSRRLGVYAAAAAAVLAFSRVYVGAHFPVDVLAGLALGAAVSWLGFLLTYRLLLRVVVSVNRSRLCALISAVPHMTDIA